MTRRLEFICVALTSALLIVPSIAAQSVVDFREAVRMVEPSLSTVIVLPSNSAAENPNVDRGNPAQPRFPLFDLDGRPVNPLDQPQPDAPIGANPVEFTSAAFAVDQSTLIAYLGDRSSSVTVRSANGTEAEGKVIALDYVTGLAAIRVAGEHTGLLVSTAPVEPGMPVIATWINDGVLTADAGIVSTRPVSTGSGVGLTPKMDFGSSTQAIGTPLIDSNGIVVGVLVPSRDGSLACASSASVFRLIETASGDQPKDLKRGLVGIQFESGGALVMEVSPDSAAVAAGIQAGDLIQRVNDHDIRDASDVVAVVANARAGDTIEFIVQRDGESISMPVQLNEHPQQRLARQPSTGNRFGMQQGFQLRDGQLVPMEIDPDANAFPFGPGRRQLNDLLREFQRPGNRNWPVPPRIIPDDALEDQLLPGEVAPNDDPLGEDSRNDTPRSEIEKTLRDLQQQMQRLNKKFEQTE